MENYEEILREKLKHHLGDIATGLAAIPSEERFTVLGKVINIHLLERLQGTEREFDKNQERYLSWALVERAIYAEAMKVEGVDANRRDALVKKAFGLDGRFRLLALAKAEETATAVNNKSLAALYGVKYQEACFDKQPEEICSTYLACKALEAEAIGVIDAQSRENLVEKACGPKREFERNAYSFAAGKAASLGNKQLADLYEGKLETAFGSIHQ